MDNEKIETLDENFQGNGLNQNVNQYNQNGYLNGQYRASQNSQNIVYNQGIPNNQSNMNYNQNTNLNQNVNMQNMNNLNQNNLNQNVNQKKPDIQEVNEADNKNFDKSGLIFMFVILVIVGLFIIFLPTISNFLSK